MRVLVDPFARLGNTDLSKQVFGFSKSSLLVSLEVIAQRLGDLLTTLLHRVERCHRVLEDHRHLDTPKMLPTLLCESPNILALKNHIAADLRGSGQEVHQGLGSD